MDDIRKKRADGIRAPRPALRKPPVPPVVQEKEPLPEEFVRKENSWVSHLKQEKTAPRPFAKEISQGSIRNRMARFGVISGILVGVGFLILLSTTFARATIRVKPHVEEEPIKSVQAIFDVSASGVQLEQHIVPVEKVSFEYTASQDFQPTGSATGAPATNRVQGTVRLYNNFSTVSQALVAATRLQSSTGVIFRLSKAITVPGAKMENGKLVPQFVEASVSADAAGPASIADGTKFSIPGFAGTPKAEKFYAVAQGAFQLPAVSAGAKTVTAEDLKQASEQVTKQAFDEIRQQIKSKTPPGFISVEPLQQIQITKLLLPAKNTKVDVLHAEATAVGQAFLFRQEDLVALAADVFKKDTNNTRELMGDSLQFSYQVLRSDFANGRAEATISGQGKSKRILVPDEIIAAVAGKKEGTLTDLLRARTDIDEFQLSFFPPWRLTTPTDPAKINVEIIDI